MDMYINNVIFALIVVCVIGFGILILEEEQNNTIFYGNFCKANGCQQFVAMDTIPYCYNCQGAQYRQLCMNYTGFDCLCPSQTIVWFTGCGCPPINRTVRWC